MIQPGATLGLIGGGQLGRMFTQAAQRMGFEIVVLDPDPTSPAGRIATRHLCAAYTDVQALTQLGQITRAATIASASELLAAARLRQTIDGETFDLGGGPQTLDLPRPLPSDGG